MIRFQDVCKSYPDGTEAVRDFTLEAPTGKTTVLVGSSGCGKTTLLRMVNRMVDPTSGAVWIDDENVADVPPVPLRRRIGYVMQNAGLLPHRKVIDNIATVPLLNGTAKAEAHRRALELMELVGEDDILILTADHGCDPTWTGTDHTREHIPVLIYGPKVKPGSLGHRETFADIGQTLATYFGTSPMEYGKNML